MSESVFRGHPASSGVAMGPSWSYAAPEPAATGTAGEEQARVETGLRLATAEPPPGAIVLAEDLGPADVAGWARLVAGIALAGSGATAHAAIVARSLAIPLVTGVGPELLAVPDGELLAVDADRGLVLRRIDSGSRARLERRIAAAREEAERNRAERLDPAVTLDGRVVRLL